MQVHTHIANSLLTVQLRSDWEHYIDAQRDVRYPDYSLIEVVRAGRVRHREKIHNSVAPDRIVQLMRGQM